MENKPEPDYLEILGNVNVDEVYILQVFEYYRQRYLSSKLAQEFVFLSERIPDEIRENTLVGFCDRTLGSQLPGRRTFDGGPIRGCLQRFGLIKASGHELFRGCVVFPEEDENHQFITAVGYRVASRIRRWESPVIYWQKPEPQAFIANGMNSIRQMIHEQTRQ